MFNVILFVFGGRGTDIEAPVLQGIVRSAPLTFEVFYVPLRNLKAEVPTNKKLRAPVDQAGQPTLELLALLGVHRQVVVCV